MSRLRLITLCSIIIVAAQAQAFSISGHVGGGQGFPLRWVYAIPTSLDTFFITVCNPFNNNYSFSGMDAGGYLLFAYQDLNTSLTPDLDEPRGFYGGDIPQVLQLEGDSEGVDIELSPPNSGGFTGTVTYDGTQTGATYIVAYRAPDFAGLPSGVGFLLTNTGNGDYTAFVDSFGIYYAQAYLDANANFVYDVGEPYDAYGEQNPEEIDVQPTDFPDNINFTLIQLDSREPRGPLPTVAALGEIYPNPFNAATTIPFTLSASAQVRIVLYDLLGRELFALAEGVYGAGEHDVKLSGFDLASGIYYVELQAAGVRMAKRMVLVR